MKILAIPKGEIDRNACQFRLYEEMEKLGCQVDDFRLVEPFQEKYEIIHIHWPELFTDGKTIFHALKKSLKILYLLGRLKNKGSRVVWTCHDVISHKQRFPRLEKYFMRMFIHKTDGIIAPLKSAYTYAVSYFPQLLKKSHVVIPTGHYIGIYPNETDQPEARERLKLPAGTRIIGFIGNISEYKGIYELLDAFSKIEDQNTLLLLAGIPNNKQIQQDVEKVADKNQRIKVRWGLIPNNELQLYLNTADVIVLPFRKINNSGSLYLALSFNKHTLVPDFPQMLEVKKKYAPEHVHTYPKGKLSSTDLTKLLENVKNDVQPDLAKMDYEVLAGETIDFFNSLVK